MTTKSCIAMHSELWRTHIKLALHLGTLAYIHKASPVLMHSGFWLIRINLALQTLIQPYTHVHGITHIKVASPMHSALHTLRQPPPMCSGLLTLSQPHTDAHWIIHMAHNFRTATPADVFLSTYLQPHAYSCVTEKKEWEVKKGWSLHPGTW